jgi:uncharacterized protein YbbC (DUF1343 family)
MAVRTGLDELISSDFAEIRGKRIAVLCNQASVNHEFRHILEILQEAQATNSFQIVAVFGPQHGLSGTTQDNMIEWNGEGADTYRYPVYSLYGEHREPTEQMLAGIDLIVVDLPDVGARYYTFMWTMTLVMKAAECLRVPMLVLDRPNPIGSMVEGPVLEPEFASFVGLHPLPIRHGMTIGEIANLVASRHYPKVVVDIIKIKGWDRNSYADQNGYAWVMPSPNMPTIDTAVVYPGGCLIEGTNLSEGRGTTKPFEIVGAPWLDGQNLANSLNHSDLNGVHFRPIQFEPTFNKYQGQLCNGVFIHVIDREKFEPILAFCAIMIKSIKQTGLHDSSNISSDRFQANGAETKLPGFAWKQPPYEYEYEKMPIDILFGNNQTRNSIEEGLSLELLRKHTKSGLATLHFDIQNSRLYEG